MNMSISPDLMSATISTPASRPASPPREGGVPAQASATDAMGGSLTNEARDSVLAGAMELEESGASSEKIKSFVSSELAANGVDVSSGHQRSGKLVDMMS